MKKSRLFLWPLLVLGMASSAWAAGRQQLHGHVPAAVASSVRLGDLEASTPMEVVISLPERNAEALHQYIRAIYDKHNPLYGQALTPAQFAERYGPTAQDYEKLRAFVAAQHLTVTATTPNRLLLEASGTAFDIERAFHVGLGRYQRKDGSIFFAPDNEPSLDLDLPVLHISGLDNAQKLRPALHASGPQPYPGTALPASRSTGRPLSQSVTYNGSAPGSLYWGSDFRNAYVPGTCLSGSGQSVALVEFEGYYSSDIKGYESLTGLPNVTLTNVAVDGFRGVTRSDSDGILEVSLDIEMAIAMAPGLSQVRVYEAPNNTTNGPDLLLDQIATDDKAQQISCSWTGFGDAATTVIFDEFASQRQSFFQAAGDDGAYVAGDPDTTAPGPINFSPELEMTVVGGTQLGMNGSGGSYLTETTWNAPLTNGSTATTYAGGGGVCSALSIPSYQTGVNMSSNGGSTSLRNIPDVSMVAYGIFVLADKSYVSNTDYEYYFVVGTSAATPLWAGFTALANQQGEAGGVTLGFLNPALYSLGEGGDYGTDFHDIADGSNNNLDGNPFQYSAVTGYDLATGWGSPSGQALINDLTGVSPICTATPTSTRTATLSPTPSPTWTPTPTPLLTATPTATKTPTVTFTSTLSATPSSTTTPSVTSTPSITATPSRTITSTPTITNTFTATATPSMTNTPTVTPDPSDTPTASATSTPSITPTPTPSVTPDPTETPTVSGTPTPSVTNTSTATPSVTLTFTPDPTETPSGTATGTSTPSATPDPTDTPTPSVTDTPSITATPSVTATPTETATGTLPPTDTPSVTLTPTPDPTDTPTASITNTPSVTDTPSVTHTPTASVTPDPTDTPTASITDTPSVTETTSATQTPSVTDTSTASITSTPSMTDTPTSTMTATPSVTDTPSITNTPSITDTPTASVTPDPTDTPTASITSTPSVTATPTSTMTATPSVTDMPSITNTPSITDTPTASITPTSTITETSTPSVTLTPTESPTPSATPTGTITASPTVTFSATSTATGPANTGLYFVALPNLVVNGSSTQFFATDNGVGLGGESRVFIYTLSGELVQTLALNDGAVTWNLKNASGESVASGLYFAYLLGYPATGGKVTAILKVAVIR